jgi:hypothetical protein
MRAPPLSFRPMTGAPFFMARSMILQIFSAWASQGAAEDGEVLREDVDQAAIDGAVAGHHAVAHVALLLQAEVVAAVGDEHVQLAKAALVQHEVQALARGQLALGVLFGDALLAAASQRLLLERTQLFDSGICSQREPPCP